MSNGDTVHATFLQVWGEGIAKQFFLIIFMVMFFTAFTNIFYAIMQDGYDKGLGETYAYEKEVYIRAQLG
jgi:hypothetical protein